MEDIYFMSKEALEDLIKWASPPTKYPANKTHLFFWACSEGNLGLVKDLVEKGYVLDSYVFDDLVINWGGFFKDIDIVNYLKSLGKENNQ